MSDQDRNLGWDESEIHPAKAVSDHAARDLGADQNFEASAAGMEEARKYFEANDPKANIVVIGSTGVGKSTLINAVFGDSVAKVGIGQPVTREIRCYSDPSVPVRVYDTEGLEMHEDTTRVVDDVLGLIRKGQEGEIDDRIHMVWYCVLGSGGLKFEAAERNNVARLARELPVVLVSTQVTNPSDPRYVNWVSADIRPDELDVVEDRVVSTLAAPLVVGDATIGDHGVSDLIETSLRALPEAVQRSFIAAVKVQEEIIDARAAEARKVVWLAAAASGGVGLSPLTFGLADAALIAPIQMGMMVRIGSIFGLDKEDKAVAALTGMAIEHGLMSAAGKAAASQLAKLIPGFGNAIAGAVAFVLTLALGEAYIQLLAEVSRRRARGEEVIADELFAIFKDTLGQIISQRGKNVPKG